jgi:hypothetical protein
MPGPNPAGRSLYPAGFTLFPALLSLFTVRKRPGFSKTRAQYAEQSFSVSPFERLGRSSSVLLGSPPVSLLLSLPKPWRGLRHDPPLCRLNTLSPPMEHSRSWAFPRARPPDLDFGGTHSWVRTGQDPRCQVSEAGKRGSGDRHRVPFPVLAVPSLHVSGTTGARRPAPNLCAGKNFPDRRTGLLAAAVLSNFSASKVLRSAPAAQTR